MRGGWIMGLVLVCWASWAEAILVDRVVAVVNGEIITWSEVESATDRLLAQAGPKAPEREDARRIVLDSLINDILVRQEAERLQVRVSDAEIESEVRAFKARRRLSDAEFQHGLTLQGISLEEFKKQLRDEILRRRILNLMVQRKVVVTDEEVQAYYEANAGQFRRGRHLTIQVVVLPNRDDALRVHTAVQRGEITLEQAVREYSVGPREADGVLEVAWNDLDAAWREALAQLPPGQLSTPFAVQGKWVVVRVVRERSTEESGLEAVRDEIREILARPKLEERFQEYMASLRAKALIDVRL